MSPRRSRRAGFTTIELMIVLTIAAVLIAFAAPSFADFLSKRRVDGVMAELVTDLHYARSEAVSRNAPVRITFGPRCYVIHLASASSAECDASTAAPTKTIAPTAAAIRKAQLPSPGLPGFTQSWLNQYQASPDFAGAVKVYLLRRPASGAAARTR